MFTTYLLKRNSMETMKNTDTDTNTKITTSAASINQETYSTTDTYELLTKTNSDITQEQLPINYFNANERTKVSTPRTRKQDEMLDINEKLKNLELCI